VLSPLNAGNGTLCRNFNYLLLFSSIKGCHVQIRGRYLPVFQIGYLEDDRPAREEIDVVVGIAGPIQRAFNLYIVNESLALQLDFDLLIRNRTLQ
jgi:hypothetical protein